VQPRARSALRIAAISGALLLLIVLVALGLGDYEAPDVRALLESGKTTFEGVTIERAASGRLSIRCAPNRPAIVFSLVGTAALVAVCVLALDALRSAKLSRAHKAVITPLLIGTSLLGLFFIWGRALSVDEVTIDPAARRVEARRTYPLAPSSSQALRFDEVARVRVVWVPSRSAAKLIALRLERRDGSGRSLFRVLGERDDLGAFEALSAHVASVLEVETEPTTWTLWHW
jgi:hypothetical protein